MRRWRIQAHEGDQPRVVMFIGVGIGIAFGLEVAIDRHFDSDPDADADSGILGYQLCF